MADAQKTLDDIRAAALQLRDAIPGVWNAYADMGRAAMGDGALLAKHKQLIALAIAVTRECDGCIASHARGAVRAGASLEETAEALGVAIHMNGGPGTVWGPRAFEAFMQFGGASGSVP